MEWGLDTEQRIRGQHWIVFPLMICLSVSMKDWVKGQTVSQTLCHDRDILMVGFELGSELCVFVSKINFIN